MLYLKLKLKVLEKERTVMEEQIKTQKQQIGSFEQWVKLNDLKKQFFYNDQPEEKD